MEATNLTPIQQFETTVSNFLNQFIDPPNDVEDGINSTTDSSARRITTNPNSTGTANAANCVTTLTTPSLGGWIGDLGNFINPVSETDNEVKYSVDVPGVSKDQLTVKVIPTQGVPTLAVNTVPDSPRSYALTYNLVEGLDLRKATSVYLNGVLNITIPKLVKGTSVTEIDVPIV